MPRILLVDDDELGRDALARRLLRKGYQVTVGSEGEECLTLARSEKPDLVVLAMNLSVPDGWEVTRTLKSEDGMSQMPVIGLIEENTLDEREKAIDAGCDDFEPRPIHADKIIEKIQRLLDRQAAH